MTLATLHTAPAPPAPARRRPTDRPGTDELVVRYRLIRNRRLTPVDLVPPCATVDPEVLFPDVASGVDIPLYKQERQAVAVCEGCPLIDACLVQEMREVASVFQIRGVRAGLKQSERRALYRALEKADAL